MEHTVKSIESLWQSLQRESTGNLRSDYDAEFLGWQDTLDGETIALYVIKAPQHPLYRSTVTAKTLREYHIEVPPTPDGNDRRRKLDDEE
jgi:hypothetical protein